MLQNLFLTDWDSSSYGKGTMLEALCKQRGPGPPAARPGFHINRLQTLELTDGRGWVPWDRRTWAWATDKELLESKPQFHGFIWFYSQKDWRQSNCLIVCLSFLLLPSIFPGIRVFAMSWLFASGGQSIGALASVSFLSVNIRVDFL